MKAGNLIVCFCLLVMAGSTGVLGVNNSGGENSTLAPAQAAELKLSNLFTDHAVLQCGIAVPIWGRADAGAKVTVEFCGQKKTATADPRGQWMVKLDPLRANTEARDLVVTAGKDSVKRRDILVGEVWLCSGQSNMSVPVAICANAEQEIAAVNHPQMRLFTVAYNPSLKPLNEVKGQWEVCSSQTASNFSAAAYYFGRKLHQDLKVPVGLIHSSVGASPAEAWTRLEALKTIPVLGKRAAKEIAQMEAQPEAIKRFPIERAAWEKRYGVKPPPVVDQAKRWSDPGLDTSDWKKVTTPFTWNQLGFTSGGAFWIRRDIDLPASVAGKTFCLVLYSMIEQYDIAFWNGVEIGRSGDVPPEFYMGQRYYPVPANLVKAGRNVLVIRVVSATEKAEFSVQGRGLNLPLADPTRINDEWLLKQESAFAPLPADALASRPKPNDTLFRLVSSALYNGMIAPLMPFAIRGAIWYQGESNVSHSSEYRELLTLMIQDWRKCWGQGNFAFYIQQIVNVYDQPKDVNEPAPVAWLREAQIQVTDTVPNTGIAIGIDIGGWQIHPENKQDVGKRLALVALEKTYRRKIESSGPRYAGMKIHGGAIRLKFTHAKELSAKGGPLRRFAIAGVDKKFFWADAKVEGETVLVSSPQVPQPVAVRYAWANNPDGCNLYNGAALPAAPFRTDEW